MAKRSEETITCEEIMVERDRLIFAAFTTLCELASTGVQTVKEGSHDLTLSQIFVSWHSQGARTLICSSDCSSELRAQINAVTANFFEVEDFIRAHLKQ